MRGPLSLSWPPLWRCSSLFCADSMKLIVGLGNPGREYASSRHNVGFQCLDSFAQKHGLGFGKRQFNSRIATGMVEGQQVMLAKPQTFMNRSGDAVGPMVHFFRLPLPDLLVIHDDLDLPLGRIRIRERGGAGGHNGIKSIIASLGGERQFPRIRVGIGRPGEDQAGKRTGEDVIDYVLSSFTPDETAVMKEVCMWVNEVILCVLREGIISAMNRYNQGGAR